MLQNIETGGRDQLRVGAACLERRPMVAANRWPTISFSLSAR